MPSCRLIVIPHGPINLVPFSSLVDPNRNRVLIDDFTVSYMPMSNLFVQTTFRRDIPDSNKALLIGISKFDGFRDLRYTEAEIEALDQIIDNESNMYLQSGRMASKYLILKKLSEYSVIHIATHGFFDAYNPLMSYLVLKDEGSRDTPLYAYEFLRQPLAAKLVVLSACETNQTIQREMTPGEDLLGFPWALLAAGADRVVVSLWKVKDDSTKNLMTSFYKQMQKHLASPADSLRAAQQVQRSKTPHPYHWAAFSLIGRPR